MATRVDFYVLPGTELRALHVYACRLVEKAWSSGLRVCVRLDGPDEAAAFDDLLWTFADRAFVPHERLVPGQAPTTAVVVCAGEPPPGHGGLLVNLAGTPPASLQGFERVADFVDADEGRRRLGRDRFRYYREQGVTPESHTVGAAS